MLTVNGSSNISGAAEGVNNVTVNGSGNIGTISTDTVQNVSINGSVNVADNVILNSSVNDTGTILATGNMIINISSSISS